MKLKYRSFDIRRSETTTIRVKVPLWETPLLEALHGRVNLAPMGDELIEATAPDAEAEFERFGTRYGNERRPDGSIGMRMVEAVYGQFQPGIMNLQRSIDAAVVA